jgi:hypothetical protein
VAGLSSAPPLTAPLVLQPQPKHQSRYSIFDPSLFRNHAAERHFPQENATFDALDTSRCGSEML